MSTPTLSHKLIRATALVFGIALSGGALAQDAGFYVGASVGQSDVDIDTSDAAAAGLTGISRDETDTAWKLNLGYQFNRHWGMEVGYVDFGEFKIKGTFAGLPLTANADLKAWTLAGVGTLPLGTSRFSLFGKLGVAWSESDGRGSVGGVVVTGSDSETEFFGGIGLRYDFNSNFGVQLEAEYYNFADKALLYTAGVRYKF